MIWSIMKARCCWIWRLSIYGAVLSETSATCASKRWGASCLCYTWLTPTALINPASWTVAVKAKEYVKPQGKEPQNGQMRNDGTIKEQVNDAQMCWFFFSGCQNNLLLLSMYWRQGCMIWKVTKSISLAHEYELGGLTLYSADWQKLSFVLKG